MYGLDEYSLQAIIGMLVLGVACTTLGVVSSLLTLFKGEIVLVGRDGKVIIREKIKDVKPFRIRYFLALVFTLMFGPLSFLVGIIGLFTFISTLIIK